MVLLAFLSAVVTIAHTRDEVWTAGARRGVPVWEYLRLPLPLRGRPRWWLGFALLAAFGAVQVGLAWAGYAGGSGPAIVALLVIRLGDCVLSHWWPWWLGLRPNPGLSTTPLYVIDAALAACVAASWWY